MQLTAKPERTYGLVVGIEKYHEPQWNVFGGGQAEDALRFARWLCGCGVPQGNIRLCLSLLPENDHLVGECELKVELATEQNLYDIVTNFLSRQSGDLLYIFWAGHGLISSERERRLICADATKQSWLNLDLHSLLLLLGSDRFGIRHHVCIIDACANYLRETPTNLGGKTFPSGKPRTDSQQFVLLAAREGETAKVNSAEKTGYFSQAVREVLIQGNESFPPDMLVVAEQVKQRLQSLDKKQTPIYLYRRSWDGDQEESVIGTQTAPQNLPRSGVKKFVGREEDLETLYTQLQQTQRVAITTVTGMGGIGKTELALQYAQYHWERGTYSGGVCWLRVQGEDAGTQIVKFAIENLGLQLPEDWDLQTQINYIWRRWTKGDVLLVWDDVSKYEHIEPYLPPTELRFKILITTRQQWLGESFERLCLEVLEEKAALELLVAFVGDERIQRELQEAKLLCADLGFLPLGLELVARYLQRKPDLSVTKMRQRLALTHRSMQERSAEMTARRGVAAAFELSWRELNNQAKDLGCLLSMFALAPIPWNLVERCLPDQDSEDLEDVRDDFLVGLSLLERTGEETYQLHQLIREFMRNRLEELAEADKLNGRFCQVIVKVAQSIPDSPTLRDIANVTDAIPHLEEVATVYPTWLNDNDLICPFAGLYRFYAGQGAYEQALPWLKKCESTARERFGDEHPSVATSLNNLAMLYQSQGRYTEAEPLLVEALAMTKRLLGDEHPSVAISLNNLALIYQSQGRYSEAEPLYIKALAMYKRLLGDEHPNVARSLNNLALIYNFRGRYTEAEPLLVETLAMYKCLLGDEHLDVATSLNNLAMLYQSQGRYTEAEPLLVEALAMTKRLLGDEHPSVAISLNNLALIYQSQGRYSEAEPLYIKALAMYKRLLGDEHPSVATSLNNLALIYNFQGRYSEAEPLLVETLAMYKRLLGDEHPDVARSLNNLALIYNFQGRYSEAEPLLVETLAMYKRLLGNEHPDVARSLSNLAMLYQSQGRYSKAQPLLVETLAMYKRLLGDEHPDVALSLNNLALIYQSQGRYSEAEPLFIESLDMRKRVLGNEHPSVAIGLNNLAAFYQSQGRYNETETLYIEALAMTKRLLGDEHPNVALSLSNLADLYCSQGRYSEAEPLSIESLAMYERLLGDEHPDVALSLKILGYLYKSQGRYSEAETLFIKALSMTKHLLGDEHPDVATNLNTLGEIYYSQGRYNEAEPLLVETLAMRKNLLGDEHPDVATSLNNLAMLYQSQGRYSEAEPLLVEALAMRKRLLGDEHPNVALSLNNLAMLYNSQGRYSEAETLFIKALAILEQRSGASHPNTITVRDNLEYLRRNNS
ncbi:tetratricopeptide repeat protein [Anabaena sp. CCY 9402-a]|uniref:tetratricopeptide repeat protein n=1 Tax=Anabaena sp. CCY 9402-a TaxID=3103867 RepID=UPI0039C61296